MKTRLTCILAIMALFTVANVWAQSGVWTQTLGHQLAQNIESESRPMKSRAIQQAQHFATYRNDANLKAAVPALVRVYRYDPDPKFRLAAVSALHAIGNDAGMQAVRAALSRQTDQRVQMVSIAALRDHFGLATFTNSKEIADMARSILETRRTTEPAVVN